MALDPFVEFLEDEAGDSVRAAGWYQEDEFEILYLREDLDSDLAQLVADELHEQLTWDWNPPSQAVREYFGSQMASIGMYRDSVVLHLPSADGSGAVVTLDIEVARNLHGFIQECREALEYET